MLVFPVLVICVLFLVPFISNRGERAPSRRPAAVLLVVVAYTTLGALTYEGTTAPWSPKMTAWSGDPVPEEFVKHRSPAELQGALVFQYKNCRNCHALDGLGGDRGPDLTTIGTRMTRNQLIDQVSNGTPGGGNMRAGLYQQKNGFLVFSGSLRSSQSTTCEEISSSTVLERSSVSGPSSLHD